MGNSARDWVCQIAVAERDVADRHPMQENKEWSWLLE
jgi:hypothetical protein